VRDYDAALEGTRFWDAEVERVYAAEGEALVDCALQSKGEVVGLCRFIETERIRSYLEIGIWTGQLVTALHRVFRFRRVAACDHGWAEQCGFAISVPDGTSFFRGDSGTEAYLAWRRALGPIDLVMIDANHHYCAVRRDFQIERAQPHRFLALHDITGARRGTEGVARLWRELDGNKLEIVEPGSRMGIGIWSTKPSARPTP
jgi:hypothetical protein